MPFLFFHNILTLRFENSKQNIRTGVSDKSLLSLVERDNNFDVNNDILSVFTGHEISEDSPRSSDDVSLGSDVFSDVNDPFFAQGESTTAAIAATSGASLDSKLDLARAYIDIGDHEAAGLVESMGDVTPVKACEDDLDEHRDSPTLQADLIKVCSPVKLVTTPSPNDDDSHI